MRAYPSLLWGVSVPPLGPDPAHSLSLCPSQAKNSFHILKGLIKNKKEDRAPRTHVAYKV